MLAGKYKERDNISLSDMRELIGKVQTGKIGIDELLELEQLALPTYGTCAMLGTANSHGING